MNNTIQDSKTNDINPQECVGKAWKDTTYAFIALNIVLVLIIALRMIRLKCCKQY